jgi:Lysine methyltransferase
LVDEAGLPVQQFDTIVASDVLLYVSLYPALIKALNELMPPACDTLFIMSWNPRMKESAEFFERAQPGGFDCKHEGKRIYLHSSEVKY